MTAKYTAYLHTRNNSPAQHPTWGYISQGAILPKSYTTTVQVNARKLAAEKSHHKQR